MEGLGLYPGSYETAAGHADLLGARTTGGAI